MSDSIIAAATSLFLDQDEAPLALAEFHVEGEPANKLHLIVTKYRLWVLRLEFSWTGKVKSIQQWAWFALRANTGLEIEPVRGGTGLSFWNEGVRHSFVGRNAEATTLCRVLAEQDDLARVASEAASEPEAPREGGPAPSDELPDDALERVVRLQGSGHGKTKPFVIPDDVLTWRLRWSCGPDATYPILYIERPDGTGVTSGGRSEQPFGELYAYESGRFVLEVSISDSWWADVEIIEREEPLPEVSVVEHIETFRGTGSRSMSPFQIPAEATEWRVRWRAETDESPQIHLYWHDEDMTMPLGGRGARRGESLAHETGTFDLSCHIDGGWTIEVDVLATQASDLRSTGAASSTGSQAAAVRGRALMVVRVPTPSSRSLNPPPVRSWTTFSHNCMPSWGSMQ